MNFLECGRGGFSVNMRIVGGKEAIVIYFKLLLNVYIIIDLISRTAGRVTYMLL
jgi:hypothetical protein